MQGLWADGWFYLSAASLLVSGVLFFFLLGQYRAAAEAADRGEGDLEIHPVAAPVASAAPVRSVYIPDEPAPAKVASVAVEKPAEKPLPKPETPAAAPTPAYEGPERRRENTTGGLSPAVLYLQSIKNQLDTLNGSVAELSKRVDAVTGRDEALIERLGELTAAVAELKAAAGSAPAAEAAPAPAPKRAKKAEPKPEPKPEPVPEPAPAIDLSAAVTEAPKAEAKPEPKPEPKTEPVPEPKTEPAAEPVGKPHPAADETVRLQLGEVIDAQIAEKKAKRIPPPPLELSMPAEPAKAEPAKAEPAPEPKTEAVAEAAAPAEEDKPRRGPVWPV